MLNTKNYRSRVLLEYRQINKDSLLRADALIWTQIKSTNWCLHDKDTWNGMILVEQTD